MKQPHYNLGHSTPGADLTNAASFDAMADDSQTFRRRLIERDCEAINAASAHVPASVARTLGLTYKRTMRGVVMIDATTGRRVGKPLPRR